MPENIFTLCIFGAFYEVHAKNLLRGKLSEKLLAPADFPAIGKRSQLPLRRFINPPKTPAESKFFESEPALTKSKELVDTKLLVVENLRISNEMTIGKLHEYALAESNDPAAPVNRLYDIYSRKHFGTPYSALIHEKRSAVLERFDAAFSTLSYRVANRSTFAREVLMGDLELYTDRSTVDELVELAEQGHILSQLLAALLLYTYQRQLTKTSIKLFLEAHQNQHPEALNALAERLLVQDDLLGALQCSLLAKSVGVDAAERTTRLIVHVANMRMIGGTPLAHVLLHKTLDEKWQRVAKEHFPEWFPTQEERMRAFFERFNPPSSQEQANG